VIKTEVIRRRKLHEEVASRLEAAITSGEVSAGERLPSERALMERYGVGRPAIRQALLSLEKMGLVRIASGERALVTRPSPQALVGQLSGTARYLLSDSDGVRHFQAARLFFETGLARHAAEHASDEQIARLKAALDQNENDIGDAEAFNRSDVAFHYQLAVIPENPIFVALHGAMVEWLTEQRTITLQNEGADRRAFRSHRLIYEAIAARDPDRAEEEMRAHLLTVSGLYWQAREGG